MNYKHICTVLSACIWLSCSNEMSSTLIKRGISPENRKFQAENTHSLGLSQNLVDSYKDGYIQEGMTQDMVFELWGEPNRKSEDGTTWEYTDKKGELISSVQFDSTAKIRKETYPIVTKILGDRLGGSKNN